MRIGIYGYGNLGRGVECAIGQNPDMELVGIFTRRNPADVHPLTDVPVYAAEQVGQVGIDVLILCGGSATDLPQMSPMLARNFHIVDSFDTHAKIPTHFAAVDAAAREGGHVALIAAGWDPGLFSLNRLYASAILPQGEDYTFWGRGVSQGHSDAIRRIEGVQDARQYTVPVDAAVAAVRRGDAPVLSTRQKHTRECFVVAKEGADLARIEKEIKQMPNYFADYDTSVTFLSQEQLDAEHRGLPHGGCVIRTGVTGLNGENKQCIEYRLNLDSNPEFTASVLVAYVRAVYRRTLRGESGAITVFDVAPAELSPMSAEQLREKLL